MCWVLYVILNILDLSGNAFADGFSPTDILGRCDVTLDCGG